MRSYSMTFYTPGATNERDSTYLLVAGQDPNLQKMGVLVFPFTESAPEPRRAYIFTIAQNEEGAIKEAADELRMLPGNQSREEMLYPLEQSEIVRAFRQLAP